MTPEYLQRNNAQNARKKAQDLTYTMEQTEKR